MALDVVELALELERSKSKKSGGSNADYLKQYVRIPQGNGFVIVRLLPQAPPGMFGREKSRFYVPTRTHKLNDRTYHCPNELQGKYWKGDCPICQYCRYLWTQSEENEKAGKLTLMNQQQALYRVIKATERFYFNAIARQQFNPETNTVETNVGPLVFSVGQKVKDRIFLKIVGSVESDKPKCDITDFHTGCDFKYIKVMTQGKDKSTYYPTYDESEFLPASPLGDPDQIEKWMSELHDLEKLRHFVDNDELKRQLKIHLKLIPDEKAQTTFDPSEFEPAVDGEAVIESGTSEPASTATSVSTASSNGHSEPATATATATEPDTKPESDVVAEATAATTGSKGLTEKDFFGKLQKMKAAKPA